MFVKSNRILQTMAGASLAIAMAASAAPAAPTWSVGPMDISGFIDGYFSANFNNPSSSNNGQVNDYYNFNDKTNQFNLNAAKLTISHDPDPIGAHIDFLYGRTNTIIDATSTASASNSTSDDQLNYIEQAFLSVKPPKGKGFELDFGKFVTSAGAEVIESKDNWNYSRSLLFSYAIPYFHFGVRTSMPVSKTETIGVQLINGWNNVTKDKGGVSAALTSAYVKPKYTWNLNYIVGPENSATTSGVRNLIDTTLLLTPNAKFNAYINYDYGQNRDGLVTAKDGTTSGDTLLKHWQGIAFAAHEAVGKLSALTGRYEYFKDYNGAQTLLKQNLQEFTATYEYKMVEGFLTRVEYRYDWSDQSTAFHKDVSGTTDKQSTLTVGFIAFFGPKR